MPVEERNITWDEMLVCPEIFVSSTTKQAMPVVKLMIIWLAVDKEK